MMMLNNQTVVLIFLRNAKRTVLGKLPSKNNFLLKYSTIQVVGHYVADYGNCTSENNDAEKNHFLPHGTQRVLKCGLPHVEGTFNQKNYKR